MSPWRWRFIAERRRIFHVCGWFVILQNCVRLLVYVDDLWSYINYVRHSVYVDDYSHSAQNN
jgi:hypothetical protein